MARIWTDRVIIKVRNARDPGSCRPKPTYQIENGQCRVYAEVFALAAQISHFHGQVPEALWELEQSLDLHPFDKNNQRRLKTYTKEAQSLESRWRLRDEARDLQKRHKSRKFSGKHPSRSTYRSRFPWKDIDSPCC